MDAGIGTGSPKGTDGFTLIELMVVVAILTLLTLTAVMGVNRPRTAGASDWARFERMHDRLREQAVMGQVVLGLRLRPEGYSRLRRVPRGWAEDGTPATWSGPVRVIRPFGTANVIAFLPSGESTPVQVAFAGSGSAGGGGAPETICESDGWAAVTCGTR